MGGRSLSVMGPQGRPVPCVVEPRSQASHPRPQSTGGGGASILLGLCSCSYLHQPWLQPCSISCSHVQATEAFLPGNSQSSCAIKSAYGHPGIQSRYPGENALGPGPGLSKSHRRPETSGASQGGARPGHCWSEVYQGQAPSAHYVPGSEGRFIDTLSFNPQDTSMRQVLLLLFPFCRLREAK